MLGTHSDYQRRGAGAMLVKWGCDLADREGMVCYVDATDKGKGLYTKFGFEDKTIPGQGAKGVSSMVRYPKQHRE
jgi:ribosomal protein S18 acetylase RimI-like enzyme